MTTAANYFLERLRDVRQGAVDNDHWATEDAEDLGLEIAEFLRGALDVPALDRELVSRSQNDLDSILWLVDALGAIATNDPSAFSLNFGADASTPVNCMARIEQLREVAEGLRTPEQLDPLEIVLRLNLLADNNVETLLAALPRDHSLKRELLPRLQEKVGYLTDDKALEFWSQLRFQVDPSRTVHFDVDAAGVGREFFDLGDASQARDRVATYLCVVRPGLERAMIEGGDDQVAVPGGLTGVASVLSWTRTPPVTEWSPRDWTVIRSLGRIAVLWDSDRGKLASVLGISMDGYFFGGRAEREARGSLKGADTKPKRLRLVDELTKLVRIAERRRFNVEGSVERTLRCFKVGAEVTAEDMLGVWRKSDEKYFQRQLVKFFAERGVIAFGTALGRSQVDVRAHDDFGAVVIETKILRGRLSLSWLNDCLTQLGSYMDQEHVALRGALVIFNFGDAPIFAPATAIRFRYLILVINLCPATPSKRSRGVEIEEAREGTDAVRFVHLDADTATAAAPRRSTKRSRKKK